MSEPVRCFKCGLILCETCGGTRYVAQPTGTIGREIDRLLHCPDCEDGWWDAETLTRSHQEGVHEVRDMIIYLGTDPTVLCPKCSTRAEPDRFDLPPGKDEFDGEGVPDGE